MQDAPIPAGPVEYTHGQRRGLSGEDWVRYSWDQLQRDVRENPAYRDLRTSARHAKEGVLLAVYDGRTLLQVCWLVDSGNAIRVCERDRGHSRDWVLERLNWEVLRQKLLKSESTSIQPIIGDPGVHPPFSYLVWIGLDGRESGFAYIGFIPERAYGQGLRDRSSEQVAAEVAMIQAIFDTLRWAPFGLRWAPTD
jgi:hypothetical protein